MAARSLRWASLTLLFVACTSRDEEQRAAPVAVAVPSVSSTESPPMDSTLALALMRFREGLPRTDTLRFALPTKDSVVRHFMTLLERRDTMGLARLHLARSEWAWIVYPESRYTHAPYRQRVDIGWMLIIERSNTALARALERRGGTPLTLVAWRCDDTPEVEGATRYWGHCQVTYRDSRGATHTERLFSSIVERDGRFKIGSYSNQF
jgi:hypothetical protein